MVWIPGGTFRMGSDRHYPEEAPVHRATVDGFWIDRTPVTNRQFKAFVKATGHVTFAEIAPDPKDYPGALPHMLYAGSLVFTPPPRVRSARLEPVVAFMKGADWRHPYGPKSNINGSTIIRRARVASRCAGLRAMGRQGPADRSRMGIRRARRARRRRVRLGRRVHARRQHMANTWQGEFPAQNLQRRRLRAHLAGDGVSAERLRRARHDRQCLGMDHRLVVAKHEADAPKACCIPRNPRGGREDGSYDPCQPTSGFRAR
jgi:hypothetical protein